MDYELVVLLTCFIVAMTVVAIFYYDTIWDYIRTCGGFCYSVMDLRKKK